jgi:hypothetical protein
MKSPPVLQPVPRGTKFGISGPFGATTPPNAEQRVVAGAAWHGRCMITAEAPGTPTSAPGPTDTMRMTGRQKDLLASIGVGILSMILFVLLMGTVVLWGQSTGQKVRDKLSTERSQNPPDAP